VDGAGGDDDSALNLDLMGLLSMCGGDPVECVAGDKAVMRAMDRLGLIHFNIDMYYDPMHPTRGLKIVETGCAEYPDRVQIEFVNFSQ
jgi:hypothetical protein